MRESNLKLLFFKSRPELLLCVTLAVGLTGCESDKHSFSESRVFSTDAADLKKNPVTPPNKVKDPEAWAQLGFEYQSRQEWPQSIYCYTKACELNPNKRGYWNSLGTVYQFSDKMEDARTAFMRSHLLDVFEMGNLESIGYVDTRVGLHDDEALRFYLMALAIDPAHKASWDNLLPVLHRLDKDDFMPRVQTLVSSPTEPNAAFVADSINEYFLRQKPDDYDLLVNKGLFQTRLLNVPMALEAFDKANKLRPESPRVLIGYGLLYDAVGDCKKAEEYLKRCTDSSPSQAVAWAMRGSIAEKSKNYKAALDNYVVASALSPEKAQWSAKIGVLDKIVKSGGKLKYEDAVK
ncbi:MAG: hypothetical protein C0508_24375 [Cyanobacteria bacterium PR.023]|nr:hypothetical protein [Cyanobacteria bacterium PR.023]